MEQMYTYKLWFTRYSGLAFPTVHEIIFYFIYYYSFFESAQHIRFVLMFVRGLRKRMRTFT